MPEFLTLLPPDDAREILWAHLRLAPVQVERIDVIRGMNRVAGEDIHAPHPLPEFARSTVDGYAVRARDTHGTSDSLPGYLRLVGEVPMGAAPGFAIAAGECAMIHTGGMLPPGADGVVMLEHTQRVSDRQAAVEGESLHEIEVSRALAAGENVLQVGEDVARDQVVIRKGTMLRPAEIGGLLGLGITALRVVKKPKFGLISTGDEVIDPSGSPRPGQVRDINSYTLSALIEINGGQAVRFGIVSDRFEDLEATAARALAENDAVIITAGSSASTRDMTAEVIRKLGEPGVLVHGVNTRPGKPTILGVCSGKTVIGLPGNPVSALVNGYLFVIPILERLLGVLPRPRATVRASLTVNLASQAGREDWWPVRLTPHATDQAGRDGMLLAEPIFGKSNLIFTLAAADGLLRIAPHSTGLSAGEIVEVLLI